MMIIQVHRRSNRGSEPNSALEQAASAARPWQKAHRMLTSSGGPRPVRRPPLLTASVRETGGVRVRILLVILCLLVWQTGRAETRLEMAKSVTDVAGMRRLANDVFGPMYPDTADVSRFCQGVFEPPGFYFLNVSLKSGILCGEAFIFQGTRDHLRLRAHLPARDWVFRKAEWTDDRLIISEQDYSGIVMSSPEAEKAWTPIIELMP
jgi:hypothetical protein